MSTTSPMGETSRMDEAVLWLGAKSSAAALKRLVAAQYPIVECDAQETASLARAMEDALARYGAKRISLIAESARAAPALLLALKEPQRVASLILLAPQIFDAAGKTLVAASDAAARFGAIDAPMLALFGTRDRSAPPEAARHYRERNPRCNLVFVYDAGEALGEERPEAVAELVADFIARRDRFLVRQHEDLLYR
ncbi:MAG TPA: alpha/beta hydrolase [Stellaceae bacterium]|nr:alpha/beta hydrolase [Stellaceae bacterium]